MNNCSHNKNSQFTDKNRLFEYVADFIVRFRSNRNQRSKHNLSCLSHRFALRCIPNQLSTFCTVLNFVLEQKKAAGLSFYFALENNFSAHFPIAIESQVQNKKFSVFIPFSCEFWVKLSTFAPVKNRIKTLFYAKILRRIPWQVDRKNLDSGVFIAVLTLNQHFCIVFMSHRWVSVSRQLVSQLCSEHRWSFPPFFVWGGCERETLSLQGQSKSLKWKKKTKEQEQQKCTKEEKKTHPNQPNHESPEKPWIKAQVWTFSIGKTQSVKKSQSINKNRQHLMVNSVGFCCCLFLRQNIFHQRSLIKTIFGQLHVFIWLKTCANAMLLLFTVIACVTDTLNLIDMNNFGARFASFYCILLFIPFYSIASVYCVVTHAMCKQCWGMGMGIVQRNRYMCGLYGNFDKCIHFKITFSESQTI